MNNFTTEFTPPNPLKTAVLFLVFNRLETTKRVFQAIRQAKPPRLYVAADGARESKVGEAEKVKVVRDYIINNIDWKCEVKTLFRNKNLGCKYAVSEGINWFFENEEMGIILEDDCLPSQSFFWFCEELLVRYKDDMRVWHIGGNNFGFTKVSKEDYCFIRFPQVWGWASWRSRWTKYDKNLTNFNQDFVPNLNLSTSLSITNKEVVELKKRFKLSSEGKIDTWDFQWHATVMINNGLCVIPYKNLVSNLGYGPDATHTKKDTQRTYLRVNELCFPLNSSNKFLIDFQMEEFFKTKMRIRNTNIFRKVIQKIALK